MERIVDGLGVPHNTNDAGQLLLHVLLIRGLPGAHTVVEANPAAVTIQCPVTRLYPFQLAALKRDYVTILEPNNSEDQPDEIQRRELDSGCVMERLTYKETLHEQLDREQLSRIYVLLRQFPVPVEHACNPNNTFSSLKVIHRKKVQLERLKMEKRLFEERAEQRRREMEKEINDLEQEIDIEGGKDDAHGGKENDDSEHRQQLSGAKRSRLE